MLFGRPVLIGLARFTATGPVIILHVFEKVLLELGITCPMLVFVQTRLRFLLTLELALNVIKVSRHGFLIGHCAMFH